MTSLGLLIVRRSIPETEIDKLWTATTTTISSIVPVELALDEHDSYRFSEENTQR